MASIPFYQSLDPLAFIGQQPAPVAAPQILPNYVQARPSVLTGAMAPGPSMLESMTPFERFQTNLGDMADRTILNSDWWFGSHDKTTGITKNGAAMPILQAAQGIMNGFMGMKQYNLAKSQFEAQKDQFAKNWAAQRTSINSQLEDRQRARVASNAGAYQSVGDYMAQNGIK